MKVSFLVLDYGKPQESYRCVSSINLNTEKIDKEIVFLSNGKIYGQPDYEEEFYETGSVDVLIKNKKNNGCGNGTAQLFGACNTEWAFYVQNDQVLQKEITQAQVDYYIDILTKNPSVFCIDLAGMQAGVGRYSERAHFVNVDRYLRVNRGEKGKLGGPGPFNNYKYSEQYVQEHIVENGLSVIHDECLFADNGKWSIREIGDGIYKHRCDTKELFVIKTPTYKTPTYPPLNDLEWDLILSNKWIDGTIPEEWKKHSFKVW